MKVLLLTLLLFTEISADNWNRIYLASYPRSGSHWIRYLVESASNIATSCVYKNKSNTSAMPWGGYCRRDDDKIGRNPHTNEFVLIKTHYPELPREKFDLQPAVNVIVLIRHPVDAIASYYKYLNEDIDDLYLVSKTFLKKHIEHWQSFYNYWKKQPNVIFIRYEDLHNETEIELSKILNLLNYSFTPENITKAIKEYPPSGSLFKHRKNYAPGDIQFMKDRLKKLLDEFGYID